MITVGSHVNVVDGDCQYTTFQKFVDMFNISGYKSGAVCEPDPNKSYKVVLIREHCSIPTYGLVYAIQDTLTGEVFLFQEEGLKPIENEPNGVDAEGKPLFFSPEDLNHLDRVVLSNGKTYIAVTNPHTPGVGHILLKSDPEEVDWTWRDAQVPEAVYACPISHTTLLDNKYLGKLRWERADVSKKRAEEMAQLAEELIRLRNEITEKEGKYNKLKVLGR